MIKTLLRSCMAVTEALLLSVVLWAVPGLFNAAAAGEAASPGQEDVDSCKDPDVAGVVKCYSTDLSIPDSPGLMIVGLGTDDVVRPTTPRQFGAALANGVDSNGNPVAGFAIDFAPYKLISPLTTQRQYKKSSSKWLLRPAWNTQFSAGVGKATDSNDKSLRIGYGASSVLWRADSSDPVTNTSYQECLMDDLAEDLTGPQSDLGSSTAEDKELAECYSGFARDYWNATAVTVGFAGTRISDDGSVSHTHSGPTGKWVSASYGFDHAHSFLKQHAEILFSWRELKNERVPDKENADSFLNQDSRQAGITLRVHGARMNVTAEKAWSRIKLPGKPADRIQRFAVGVEWKVSESTWIVTSFGGETGRKDGNETSVKTGLKFGLLDKPAFAGN